MTHIKTRSQGPALTRRDVFSVVGVSLVSATMLASPSVEGEGRRGSTINRGAAEVAKRLPFVMSF
jgi:hypothetical protein